MHVLALDSKLRRIYPLGFPNRRQAEIKYLVSMLDLAPIFSSFPDLETERLILRQVESNDAEAMFGIMSDPKVVEYFGVPPMESVDAAAKRITSLREAFEAKDGIRWALELKATGEFVGTAGPWKWVPTHFRAEIGYELASNHWRRGLMTEALTAVIDFCFQSGLHSLEANIHPDNIGSRRVLEKLGFTKEGNTRESWYEAHLGIFTDNTIFGLLDREWNAIRTS